MPTRRQWLAAALLTGCRNQTRNPEILPMELGVWRRKAVENIPGEQIPEQVRSLGLKRGRRAFYQASGPRVLVTIFEMNQQTSAFELQQKWRRKEGTSTFHHDAYFVILDGGDAAQQRALGDVVEGNLKKR